MQTQTQVREPETTTLLETRSCPQCGRDFRVLPRSQQIFCCQVCEAESPLKKPRPIKKCAPWESLKKEQAKALTAAAPIVEPITPKAHQNPPKIAQAAQDRAKPKPRGKDPEIAEIEARWERYTAEAREKVVGMNRARMEIASLAMKACQIDWGGGNHWKKFEGVYTLKRFAQEIGVNSKTLSEWVAVRRNVFNKLPEGVYDESNYMAAQRTRMRTDRSSSAKEVARVYDEELKRDQSSYYFWQGVKKLKTLRHLVINKLDLDQIDKEELAEMRQACRDIDARLSEHLADLN